MLTEGHLGCLRFSAIMNNATNIHVHLSGWTVLSSIYIPRRGTAGSFSDTADLLEELPNSFPKLSHHFMFPPEVYEGYFSTSLPILVTVRLFCYSHASRSKVVSHGFDLNFPKD